MGTAWLREERADVAVERILAGAGDAFAELGVRRTTMSDVARYAGCSRGTLYRYFETRRDLDKAFVNRQARRIASEIGAQVSSIEDPHHRLGEAILKTVHAVRSDPHLAAWFDKAESGLAGDLGRDSEVVDGIAAHFVGSLPGVTSKAGSEETRERARWVIRCIISLLSVPGEDESDERRLVERFVVPPALST